MQQIDNEKFGKFITELRKEKNLTQKELADQLFVSDKTVSKWERGASFPNVVLLIPIAECLGVSVTELLMGEYLDRHDMIQHDDVDNMVSYSLESSVKAMVSYNKRKWKIIWGISCFIVILECLYLLVSTYPLEHIRGIACVSGVMMIFALWACVYARELPSFYDENRINYVSQGIFRIHIPGLTFNNSNWPEIIKLLRFDSLCMAVGTPLFYHISILMGGYQLFDNIKLYALWIVILISIGVVYYIGKKYE